MSTDPKVTAEQGNSEDDQASLALTSQLLLAVNKEAEILYPGAEKPSGRVRKEA